MKTFFTFFLITFLSFNLFSQAPSGYYDSANGLTGVQLQSALHDIIDNHVIINYDYLWSYFQYTDKKSNGKVWDIYSDRPSSTPPYEFTFNTDKCGEYNSESDCYNREHSWPQSWFNSNSPMVSDLFHVYPTDGYVNGKRSDYPYGEVGSATFTSQNGSKLGSCNYPGYSGTVFEPIDDFKGDIARTYFYMTTRYYNEDGGWSTTDMTTGSQLKQWALDMLIEWHNADPVSDKEIARNNTIYTYQHNRNPFIDHPEYVADIWTSSINKIDNAKIQIFPIPADEVLNINYKISTTTFHFSIFNVLGQEVNSYEDVDNDGKIQINISKFEKGIYFLVVNSEKNSGYQKIIIN